MSTVLLAELTPREAPPMDAGVVAGISQMLGWASGLVFIICLAKVLFVGARIAWDRQHNPGIESTPAAELLATLVGWLLAATAAASIAAVLIPGGAR